MTKIFWSGASILAVITVGSLFFFDQIKFVATKPLKMVETAYLKNGDLQAATAPAEASSTEVTATTSSNVITSTATTELIDIVPNLTSSQTTGAVRVPILVYHSVAPFYPHQSLANRVWTVTPEVFEQQLKYLKDNSYTTISFADLNNYFASSTPLPAKPVILSFDDGWKNQYHHAFPLLKKYGLTATFFVFTNAIDHPNYFSWDELREIQNAGMAIGDHTMYHPYLFKIADEETLQKEIVTSKKILEKNLGRKVDDFAYPFGHVSNKSLEMIKKAGYKTARTNGYVGIWHNIDELYTLRSYNAKNNLPDFIYYLNEN